MQHILHQIHRCLVAAVKLKTLAADEYEAMARNAVNVTFPLDKWSGALQEQYQSAIRSMVERTAPTALSVRETEQLAWIGHDPDVHGRRTSLRVLEEETTRPNADETLDDIIHQDRSQLPPSVPSQLDSIVSSVRSVRQRASATSSKRQPAKHASKPPAMPTLHSIETLSDESGVDELSTHMDQEMLMDQVEKETFEKVFLAEPMHEASVMERVVEAAHTSAALDQVEPQTCLGKLLALTVVRRLKVWNLLLCVMCIIIPLGAMVSFAIALFAAPGSWSIVELGVLYLSMSAGIAAGNVGWMYLLRVVHIRYLWFCASLFQLVLLPMVYVGTDPNRKALFNVLAALQGIGVGSAESLFIGFNYSDMWAASRRTTARRLALVEPLRAFVSMCFVSLLARLAPTVKVGSLTIGGGGAFGVQDVVGSDLPLEVALVFWVTSGITALFGILALFIPLPERMRLPVVSLNFREYRSYTALLIMQCLTHLGGFLDLLYISYMLMANFPRDVIGATFFYTGLAAGLLILLLCMHVLTVNSPSQFTVAAVALGLFPPSLLGSLAAMWSADLNLWADSTPFWLGLALSLATVKQAAMSLLAVYSLPSRFKYVTLQAYGGLAKNLCSCASPWLVLGLSKWWDCPYATDGSWALSEVFAHSNLLLSLPFVCTAYAVGLYAAYLLAQEDIVPWYTEPTFDRLAPTPAPARSWWNRSWWKWDASAAAAPAAEPEVLQSSRPTTATEETALIEASK